jgi:hypothetical protein
MGQEQNCQKVILLIQPSIPEEVRIPDCLQPVIFALYICNRCMKGEKISSTNRAVSM